MTTTATRRRGSRQNDVDHWIERLYCRLAAGRQINILDIGKVYAAGRAAAAAGADVEAAVAAAVAQYCEVA